MPIATPPELIKKVMEYGKRTNGPRLMNPSSDSRYVSNFVELEKGCLLYFYDEAYPLKFCSFTENQVRTTMMFKRFIPDYLRFIKSKGWISRLLTIISLKVNYSFYLDYFYWFLTDTYRDPDRYCDTVRELYRILPFEKEKEIICSILEHDTGYRFPFQDIVSNLDKEAFAKNPHKEIKKLFDIAISRFSPDDANKFKNIYLILSIYLRLNRKLVKTLKEVVAKMDLEQIRPSVEDIYWMYWIKTYNCFGMSIEDRLKKYYELKNKYGQSNVYTK